MTRDLKVRWILLAVTLVAVLWGYQTMIFRHAPDMFMSPEEDMSFAWFVPLFSLYVFWTERRRFAESVSAPSFVGALILLPALFIGFLGVRGSQVRLEIAGFSLTLVALAWTFFGSAAARCTTFPAFFLWFCMPFSTYLDTVTVYLRIFGASVSAWTLEAVGLNIVRTGTMIFAADGSFGIDIAAPCSGLRSLFALMALTAGYAYFNQPTWMRRAVLFSLSVPIAIAGNVARILTIAFFGSCFSADFATGFYHDYSGYVVFIVAITLMLVASGLISKVAEKGGRCA